MSIKQHTARVSVLALVALIAAATDAKAQASAAAYRPLTRAVEYPLQPGDAIRLAFWRDQDLSGDYAVDETGTAILPIIGAQSVTNIAPTDLKRHLAAEYGKQLRNQEVQILLLRRVRVLGAVQNPNLYLVDQTMTLGDAVALAGGTTRDGKLDGIKILRDGEEITSDLNISTRVAEQIRSGDQIMVPERSWMSRYGHVIAAATISAAAIIAANAAF